MTELISKEDPRYFSQTSYIPYDRHHYKIVCPNKSFVVESWDEVQEYWWNNCRSPWFEGTAIHVIDKPKPKSNKGLEPYKMSMIIGKKAKRKILIHEEINWTLIN